MPQQRCIVNLGVSNPIDERADDGWDRWYVVCKTALQDANNASDQNTRIAEGRQVPPREQFRACCMKTENLGRDAFSSEINHSA